jgi:hypothetical protein
MVSQGFGHLPEYFIAGLMAVGVVELFEMIHIDHHHGEGFAMALEFGMAASQFFVEGSAVGQPRQGIRTRRRNVDLDLLGLLLELLFGSGQLLPHLVVGLQQLADRLNNGIRSGFAGRVQLLVDRFHPVGVLADVGGHPAGQLL